MNLTKDTFGSIEHFLNGFDTNGINQGHWETWGQMSKRLDYRGSFSVQGYKLYKSLKLMYI